MNPPLQLDIRMPITPEDKARQQIDLTLEAAGWLIQDRNDLDLSAGRCIAVRGFPMKHGFGFADYLLYLNRKACGAVEAKAEGTLTGVEAQSAKYAAGLPEKLNAHRRPLPFLFESNGAVTYFTNGLDPKPRSRKVFGFPRPEAMAEWLDQPSQLRDRLRILPPLDETGLWKVQGQAIGNLERSFANANLRALIQMATGSGKTYTAVNIAYRLLKFGGAKRVLFLVDRGNLGKQTEDEFANFTPTDDTRAFPTLLYTVQRLKSNSINPAAKVVITTIQRLYSMLKGEPDFDPANEEVLASIPPNHGRASRPTLPTTPPSRPNFSTLSSWMSAIAPSTNCGRRWYFISTHSSSASLPLPLARRPVSLIKTLSCNMATMRR